MKLNHDCIRDVMLLLERELQLRALPDGSVRICDLPFRRLYAALPKYRREDVFYSLFNLDQAGYIDASMLWSDGCCGEGSVNYMTFSGHEFLDQMRDDRRWAVVKRGLSAVANYSLSMVGTIAEGLSAGAVSAYLDHQ